MTFKEAEFYKISLRKFIFDKKPTHLIRILSKALTFEFFFL